MFGITRFGQCLLLLLLLYVNIPVLAIYESQAGSFDWHQTWTGHPREAFNIDDEHIAVYSDRNAFASINIKTGSIGTNKIFFFFFLIQTRIVWRQVLDNQLTSFKTSDAGR